MTGVLAASPMLDVYHRPVSDVERFVIFDRDETLIRDLGYTHRVEDLRWRVGALSLLSELTGMGVVCFIATNQSGLARGMFSKSQMLAFHEALVCEALDAGGVIAAIGVCPHLPGGVAPEYDVRCGCRKPRPGMLLRLATEFGLEAGKGIAVGDKQSDWSAAAAAGMKAVDARPSVRIWRDQIINWCAS